MREILDGYELIDSLGESAMSSTYLAKQMRLSQIRVIKCSSVTHISGKLLRREADILKGLNHSAIPIIYDTEVKGDCIYLVEEYCPGESLSSYVSRYDTIANEIIVNIGRQLCEVISYCHELKPYGLYYLDFKPEHVIINNNEVRLIDYGAAIYSNETGAAVGGTEGFSAPELFEGNVPDSRADVFGLGSLLYYMASGGRKFAADISFEKQRINGRWFANEKITALIKQALSRERILRTITVDELAEGLKRSLETTVCNTEKAYEIAVVGSQQRIGTSHIAISLTSYLIEKGYDALYFDEFNSGILESMKIHNGAMKLRNGLYSYLRFRGCINYGQAIEGPEINADINVRDCGAFGLDKIETLYISDIVLLVCGVREWEMEQTQAALAYLKTQQNVLIVLSGVSTSMARWFSATNMVRTALFPPDTNPFETSREKEQFFDMAIHIDGGKRVETKRKTLSKIKNMYSYCGKQSRKWGHLLWNRISKFLGKF